jgi:electron transfer flavoprotein alpha subunit
MILTFVEYNDKGIKKSTYETLTFARKMADQKGQEVGAVVFGSVDTASLGEYGADHVYTVDLSNDVIADSRATSSAIAQVAAAKNADSIVLPHNSLGKMIAGRLAVKIGAGLVTGITKHATSSGSGWQVEKNVFSGKASATYTIPGKSVLCVMPNSIPLEKSAKSAAIEAVSVDVQTNVEVVERNVQTGTVSLPEAEMVVSAGRGVKDPSNWGIIEDLADTIGATLACSRPVADAGWRPHHEHVGQTGIAIRPNLYIAIGISGAIQHLAGVNSSKVIVVINKDPEAPFFKAADYGVCADLFDVVPKLTEAIKRYQS